MSTDDLPPLLAAEDLAGRYGVSRRYVLDRARAQDWPHLKVGRSCRFTRDHVQAIDQMQSIAPKKATEQAASWGRRTRAS